MRDILSGRGGRLSLLVLAVVYAAAIFAQPVGVFWSPDEGGKLVQILNLRWVDGLRQSIAYPGQWLDPTYRFNPFVHPYGVFVGDEQYLSWPIPFPLLTWPFYTLLGDFGLVLVPALSGLGVAAVSIALARRLGISGAPWSALLVGLATPVFFYSVLFWEHTLATLLASAGFLLILSAYGAGRWRCLLAGVLLGGAAVFRAEILLLGGAMALSLLLCRMKEYPAWRPLGLFVAGLSIPLLPTTAAYYVAFGNLWPLHTGPYTQLGALPYAARVGLPFLAEVVGGLDGTLGAVAVSWILALAAGCLMVVGMLRPGRLRLSLLVAGLAIAVGGGAYLAFWQRDYRSVHGVLAVAPFAGLAATGLGTALREGSPVQRFTFVAAFLYVPLWAVAVGLVNPLGPDSAGLEWGPRFVLTVFPLLAVLSLLSLEYLRRQLSPGPAAVVAAGFVLLVGLSVAMEGRGLLSLVAAKADIAQARRAVQAMPERQVVSDLWWLQFAVAGEHRRKEFFYAKDDEELYAWAFAAYGKGVTLFWYAGFGELDPSSITLGDPRFLLRKEEVKAGGSITFTRLAIVGK